MATSHLLCRRKRRGRNKSTRQSVYAAADSEGRAVVTMGDGNPLAPPQRPPCRAQDAFAAGDHCTGIRESTYEYYTQQTVVVVQTVVLY